MYGVERPTSSRKQGLWALASQGTCPAQSASLAPAKLVSASLAPAKLVSASLAPAKLVSATIEASAILFPADLNSPIDLNSQGSQPK
jgi:hypothetical protein